MPRKARLVIPGIPHHVVQRGNRRMRSFFEEADYHFYLKLLQKSGKEMSVEILAYCLMPNHVHLILVPSAEQSLGRLMKVVHQDYSRRINRRFEWQGHLWQQRFFSTPMDSPHTYEALRYIEMNPVRANLVEQPEDYPWSSAHLRLKPGDDRILSNKFGLNIRDWKSFWADSVSEKFVNKFCSVYGVSDSQKISQHSVAG